MKHTAAKASKGPASHTAVAASGALSGYACARWLELRFLDRRPSCAPSTGPRTAVARDRLSRPLQRPNS